MQELAAKTFLKSKSDTICLVQGPPGTGKTTLLTSVICRYIIDSRKLEHNKRCLMVCAPTNKAVTVLCSRFLNTFLDVDSCPCNVVLIGDEDKLLENDGRKRGNAFTDNPRMRESLLYTFIDTVENDYLYIRKILDKGNFGLFNRILMVARRLENLLKRKVTDAEVIMGATSIVKLIEKFTKSRQKQYPTEIINKVDLVVGMVGAWNRDTIWQEILQGADVIFCTLGSSGSSLLKKVIGEVDDLVVDEAAAATEPEIYIPFQYLPRRLLCVGDPKQLPATITSQFAEKMGLSKSLHERLMYDCNYGHIMLDTQYRMKPALSEFPSQNFYGGKLRNGGNVIRSKYRGSVSMMDCATYTLYQIDGRERQLRSGSIENEAEANAVVEIVDDLRRISCNRSRNWCSANCLRIITFYQAQVNLIRRLLNRRKLGNVLVATVDSSQGCEADFVIVSFVRSDGKVGRNSVGFLADDRRLNVALTRAKYQMICVGNIKRMSTLPDGKAESVKRLAINATNRNCVHPFPFRDDSYKRPSRQNEQMNLTNKKRRLAPPGISHNSNTSPRRRMNDVDGALGDEEMVSQTAIRAHAIVDSNISSDSSSDSESSVVSTSSSSSDNTSSDSSCQDIRNCESTAQGNISTSTTEKNIESMSGFQDSVISSVPLEDTDTGSIADQNLCIKKNPKPIAEESATAIDGFYGHETSAEQSSNSAAALPNTESDTKQERPTVLDNSFDSKQMMPSVLSKTETMAVFENFSF
ncbi:unnamed protein product [Pseudo-nitzschia multistriata]|uniref:AAA+ ATPase domain-containing protein n=1 Tax=Pseudo-nitzschia multistriata TaxID=183589 RepID=A0A448ZI66_9STRA|nr:unnamed protein product [Pseudo-nitzschia multistriata]